MKFTNFSIRNYSGQDLIVKLDYSKLKPFLLESEEKIWSLLKNVSLIEKKPGLDFESERVNLESFIEKKITDVVLLRKNQVIALIKFLNTIGFEINFTSERNYEVEENYDANFPGFYVGAFCSAFECEDARMRFFKKSEIPFIDIENIKE